MKGDKNTEIKFNKIEINNEEDLKKFIKGLFDKVTEDEEERKRKIDLYVELDNAVEKEGDMSEKIIDEGVETVEELEMMLEAHKNVLNTYEKILENRKSH